MRILIDMNLSPRWKDILETGGVEAIHWSTIGAHDAPDGHLFEYAARHDLIILTHDLDFGAMLAGGGGNKPSVVQIRSADLRPETAAADVLAALRQTTAELQKGALVTVDRRRTRIRILPL